ncbi:MAG: acyl carrier protein [Treponema sp.]|jgi:acyl carrier protein|nr:acyl carrier protein [Treponema sp.]
MELNDFITKFAEQFDETEASQFKANTEFKTLVDWSSMTALSIIAMVDDEYGVIIKGDDIRKSTTIEDMFNSVKEYKSKN